MHVDDLGTMISCSNLLEYETIERMETQLEAAALNEQAAEKGDAAVMTKVGYLGEFRGRKS